MADKPDTKQQKQKPDDHRVHTNINSSTWPRIQPLRLNENDGRLNFSVLFPIQAITELVIPPVLLDGNTSQEIKIISCDLVLFLKNSGASKQAIQWAYELIKSNELPSQLVLDDLLNFWKMYTSGDFSSKHLSILVKKFLNLFKKNVVKKNTDDDLQKSLFLKMDETIPCATGRGKKKKTTNASDKANVSVGTAEIVSVGTDIHIKDIFKKVMAELWSKSPFKLELEATQLREEIFKKVMAELWSKSPLKLAQLKEIFKKVMAELVYKKSLREEKTFAFILAVMTNDRRRKNEDDFDFLEAIKDYSKDCNLAESFFTVNAICDISVAFWKAYIQESKKMEMLFVSAEEVNAYMLDFLRKWGPFEWHKNRKFSIIKRFFNEIMHSIALLSACFTDNRTRDIPKLVNVSLVIIHKVLSRFGLVNSGPDDEFFQIIGRCLKFPFVELGSEEYEMKSVIDEIDLMDDESFKNLCYRAGISQDRPKILNILMKMYKKENLTRSIHILKIYINSGKSSCLCLFMLLMLLLSQTAVFMTPCPSEIINFFSGIKSQIENIIAYESFKKLNKDDEFKKYIIKLIQRLDNLHVFDSPLSFDQRLDPSLMYIFVLSPTPANIAWIYGNNFDMLVLDDVCSADIITEHVSARNVSAPGAGCLIIVSGADVDVKKFKPANFNGYTVSTHELSKPMNMKEKWDSAMYAREKWSFRALQHIFPDSNQVKRGKGKLKYSDLIELFQMIGIDVKGDVKVSPNSIWNFNKIIGFLKYIAVHPTSAVEKFNFLIQNAMNVDLNSKMEERGKCILYDTGNEADCISSLVNSVLRVEETTRVTRVTRTLSKDSHDKKQNDFDPDSNKEGDSNPRCGSGAISTNTDKKKDKDIKKELSNSRASVDIEGKFHVLNPDVKTRLATMKDITLKTQFYRTSQRFTPSKIQMTKFKLLVSGLNLSDELKTALIELFTDGCSRLSLMFSQEYNDFVADVFRKNGLWKISTNYSLKSMNLGNVTEVRVKSSISESDAGQLAGRMERPGGGILLDLLEKGRFVVNVFDLAFKDDTNGLHGGVAGLNLDFASVSELATQLKIPEIGKILQEVMKNVFGKCSSIFPKVFQISVEKLILSAIFRGFHKHMYLTERNVLPESCACVIANAFCPSGNLSIKASSTSISDVLNDLFKTSSDQMVDFFGERAHFMLILSATKVSELQGIDTLGLIDNFIDELSKMYHVLECALCIVSMTTPILNGMKRVFQERMIIILTILKKTFDHLRKLIVTFETKRSNMRRNLENSEVKFGAVFCERSVDQDGVKFASFASSIIDSLSDRSVPFSNMMTDLKLFMSLHEESPIMEKIKSFCVKLQKIDGFRLSFFKRSSELKLAHDLLCDKRNKIIIELRCLKLRSWEVRNSTGKSFGLLSIFASLKKTPDGSVHLCRPSGISKHILEFGPEISQLYDKLCDVIVRAGFLQPCQCKRPNAENKISFESFNALNNAIAEFNKSDAHQYKLVSGISKVEDDVRFKELSLKNESTLAELSVNIDDLQQQITDVHEEFNSKIRPLQHFTRMG